MITFFKKKNFFQKFNFIQRFFQSRHQCFYCKNHPWGRWHFILDIIFLAVIISLTFFNLFIWQEKRQPSNLLSDQNTPLNQESKQEPAIKDLRFLSQARYFSPEGEQVGRGPLPPQAGRTTRYLVYWELDFASSDIQDITVEARLGQGIKWPDFVPTKQGEISYDILADKIIWKPGKVYASVDLSQGLDASQKVIFALDLTPEISQIGQKADLLKDIGVFGQKTTDGVSVTYSSPNLSTDLPFDLKAAGKTFVTE